MLRTNLISQLFSFKAFSDSSKEPPKKNWKGSGDKSIEEIWFTIKDKTEPTEFLGYETNTSQSQNL